jgi:hypothetical protein
MLFKHFYLDFVQTLKPKFENKQMVKCLRDLCGEARQHLWGKDKTQIFKTSLGKQYNYKDKEDKENTEISETTKNNKKRKKSNNDSVTKDSSNTPSINQPLSSTQLNQTCGNQFYSQQPTAPPMQYPYSTHYNQQPMYQHQQPNYQQQFNQQPFTQMQYFHPQTQPVPTQQHHLNQQPVPIQQQQQQIQQYDPQPATQQQQQKEFNLEHSALSQNDDDTCDFPDNN